MKLFNVLLAGVMATTGCQHIYANGPPIYNGTQYENVRNVQDGLRQLRYYEGPIDGINGPETRQAVQLYQGDRGLRPDGVIDARLIDSINADLATGTYQNDDATPRWQVRRVQEALSQLGYYRGRIDGELDRDTRTAIVNYRRDRRLPINDEIDRQLMESLQLDVASGPAPSPYPTSGGFVSGDRLPSNVRAVLDRRWRSYEGMLVDLDRDGDLDVIARAGQRSGDCRYGDCGYVVLQGRRGDFIEIGTFVASEIEVMQRGTNGFSDIAYLSAGAQQRGVLRFDGRRYSG
jgi:peptidoglycan hydrolase-like protein with peptidoglycan-binding domain